MQFKPIMENLKKNYKITILSNEQQEKISDIQLLDASLSAFDPRILYLGDADLVSPHLPLPAQFISTTALLPSREMPKNFVLIQEKDFASVFNYIQKLFYETLQLSNDFSQLISMSIRGENAQQIINSASEKLKNPLIVIDSGFKILLHSDNYKISDPLWIENIKRGYCTYEFITAVNEIMSKTSAPENSNAYSLNCPASPKSKLCSKIFWNNSLIGYTIMLEEDSPLTLLQREFLPNISYVVSDLLSKNPSFSGIHGSLKSILLYHILDNVPSESIAIRMKASKIDAPTKMCCIVASCGTLSSSNQWERFTQEQLTLAFPHAFITPYQGYIAALIPLSDSLGLNEEEQNKLRSLLPKVSQNFYQSQTFTNLFQSRFFFDQCIFLHDLSIKLDIANSILQYDAYAFYALLSQFPNRNILSTFISPSLTLIRQYDFKNKTSLYETLKMYIDCQYNATKTAAALYIHRNSLNYRMEKIEELTQINLNDSNQLFHLTLGYYIDDYI